MFKFLIPVIAAISLSTTSYAEVYHTVCKKSNVNATDAYSTYAIYVDTRKLIMVVWIDESLVINKVIRIDTGPEFVFISAITPGGNTMTVNYLNSHIGKGSRVNEPEKNVSFNAKTGNRMEDECGIGE